MSIIEKSSVHWQDLPNDDNFLTHTWNNQLELMLGDKMKFDSKKAIITGLKLMT
jgi:hypothetical protein